MNPVHTLDHLATRLRDRILDCCVTLEERHEPLPIWLESEFNDFALDLFRLQHRYNQPYRTFCESRGATPETVQHWSDIPAVPTTAFKEWELSGLPRHERSTVFFSSGTTEQRPSRHYHGEKSLELYETSLREWFRFNLQTCKNQRSRFNAVSLTPSQLDAPNSSLVHMFETLRKEGVANEFTFTGQVSVDGAWSLDVAATVQRLEMSIAVKDRVLLLGTAFSYVQLLDHLAARNASFRLLPGSVILETGGYKGRSRALPKNDFYALLTKHLGIPGSAIICEYGMSELSSQAYDLQARPFANKATDGAAPPSKRLFRFPPWAKVQVISPETGREVVEGETGLIRVFDLANVYSVMAIQTEDLAIRRKDGFELIGRATMSERRGCSLMSV